MKVSVICPTYNRWYTLKKAVQSFLDQDYEDKELLILNDGSTDLTAEYLKTLSDIRSIRVFNKQRGERVNVGANLNFLWSQCKGDLICQLHDDDRLYAGSLTSRVNVFKQKKVDVVYGSVVQTRKDGDIENRQFVKAEAPDANEIIYRDYINFTTLMWRKDLKFMFDETLVYELDHMFKVRCLVECRVDYTIEPVMLYAIHEWQETRRGNINGEIAKEKEVVKEKIRNLYFKS